MTTANGFIRIPNALVDDGGLGAHELLVYIALLRFRDHKTGQCWPGLTALADRARLSTKSVQRAVKGLEARGIIHVERRSSLKDPRPNLYRVALFTESPGSARGMRIPKRSRGGKDSQSTPKDSQSLPPRTPSPPNKNQDNKNQDKDLGSLETSEPPNAFTFETPGPTAAQIRYLRDLYIHLNHEAPARSEIEQWQQLDSDGVSRLIASYYRAMPGRGGMYEGPEYGTEAYEALSDEGKESADTGMLPDSFFMRGL